ncbi:unnamed protein product [Moneuplotes crassus]|uniref:Uncharacterized protein n=1 Tax=Euplotes crassus TaxID=5936 RepID=A0AAD1UFB9_EUPCR|nr:unnamed protein product [Moneuplotes crassus]
MPTDNLRGISLRDKYKGMGKNSDNNYPAQLSHKRQRDHPQINSYRGPEDKENIGNNVLVKQEYNDDLMTFEPEDGKSYESDLQSSYRNNKYEHDTNQDTQHPSNGLSNLQSPQIEPRYLQFENSNPVCGSARLQTAPEYSRAEESLVSYADKLKKYKQENESLRKMLSENSLDTRPIKPQKFIEKLVARSLSNAKTQGREKKESRNIGQEKAIFQDTQETMFETSPLRDFKDANAGHRNNNKNQILKNEYNFTEKNSFIVSQSSFENTHQRKEEDNSRNICSVNLSIPEVVPENKDQSFYEDHELLENPQKCLQKLKVEEAKTRKLTEIVEELKVQLKKTRNEIIILREEKSLKRRTKSKTKENKRQSFILNLKNPKIHTTFSKQGRCNSKKTIVKSSNKCIERELMRNPSKYKFAKVSGRRTSKPRFVKMSKSGKPGSEYKNRRGSSRRTARNPSKEIKY